MPESTRKPLSRHHAGVRTHRHSHFQPDRRAWGGSGHASSPLRSGPAPSYRLAGELAASPGTALTDAAGEHGMPVAAGPPRPPASQRTTNVHQWDIVCGNKGPTAPHLLQKKEKNVAFDLRRPRQRNPGGRAGLSHAFSTSLYELC